MILAMSSELCEFCVVVIGCDIGSSGWWKKENSKENGGFNTYKASNSTSYKTSDVAYRATCDCNICICFAH